MPRLRRSASRASVSLRVDCPEASRRVIALFASRAPKVSPWTAMMPNSAAVNTRSVMIQSSLTTASPSQRTRRVEMAVRQFDPIRPERSQERRFRSARAEAAADVPLVVGGFLGEEENLAHLYDIVLDAGHLADAGDPPRAVRQSLNLYDQLQRGGDLAADAAHRHRHAGHADHLLQSAERITR